MRPCDYVPWNEDILSGELNHWYVLVFNAFSESRRSATTITVHPYKHVTTQCRQPLLEWTTTTHLIALIDIRDSVLLNSRHRNAFQLFDVMKPAVTMTVVQFTVSFTAEIMAVDRAFVTLDDHKEPYLCMLLEPASPLAFSYLFAFSTTRTTLRTRTKTGLKTYTAQSTATGAQWSSTTVSLWLFVTSLPADVRSVDSCSSSCDQTSPRSGGAPDCSCSTIRKAPLRQPLPPCLVRPAEWWTCRPGAGSSRWTWPECPARDALRRKREAAFARTVPARASRGRETATSSYWRHRLAPETRTRTIGI